MIVPIGMHHASQAWPLRALDLRRAAVRMLAAIVCLLASWCSSLAGAADTPPAAPGAHGVTEAPLVVFNRTITTFRTTFLGITAEQRARRTELIVRELLRDHAAGNVAVVAAPHGQQVMIDGTLAFVLTDQDADALRGETAQQAAQQAAQVLQRVIAESREGRSTEHLARAAGLATAATLAALALVWLATRLRTRVRHRLEALAQAHSARVHALHREQVLGLARWLATAVFWGITLLVVYEWAGFALSQFPFTRPWGERLNEYLLTVLAGLATGILRAAPDLFVAAVIFALARIAVGIARTFFDHVEQGRGVYGWLDAETVGPTRRIATVVIWLFALVMAYPYLPGAHTEAFKGVSVLLGLMISLGASSLVGQAASGLILIYTRTIRSGEYVRIGEHEGTVVDLGMFATRIRTGLGEELTLPNSLIMGTVTRNYSRAVQGGRGYVVDTVVTIGYDAPWRQVHAMLVEAAGRTEGILTDPKPRVFQTALSDFYVEYRLVAQAIPSEPRPRAEVLATLHANIQDVFNEYGVQIMSPHYRGDPATPKLVPPDGWSPPPAKARDRPQ